MRLVGIALVIVAAILVGAFVLHALSPAAKVLGG